MCIELSERYKLLLGDFREVGKSIPDNSIDMIFTDPPYSKEYIPIYEDLAKFASRVLKNGGNMLFYSGQYWLPEIIECVKKNMNYHWIMAIKHSGPIQAIHYRKTFCMFKPMLWFTKGESTPINFVRDLLVSKYQGKEYHKWQQSTKEAEYYIRYLTEQDMIICDPFMGSGSFGISTLALHRQFIGIEKQEATFNIAEKRIKESINYQLSKWQ